MVVKRNIPDCGHAMPTRDLIVMDSRTHNGSQIAMGIESASGNPFVAMTHAKFNPPGESHDMVLTATEQGPKLTITGAVESFEIDLFALARKLAENPELSASVGRSAMRLGQAPPGLEKVD